MTTTQGKLAKEIHDEFLVCKICLEGYKNPKSLTCLHTFCEGCIQQHSESEGTYKKYSDYREFTCPLCRKRTTLPVGGVKKLPDNFLVASLGEVVSRQTPSKFPFCDFCKLTARKHKEASSKCLDCSKQLCKGCVKLHKETKVTKDHSIFDIEIEKDIQCKEHAEEVIRFYCEPCETCICVLCTFNEHKDHDISNFQESVAKYKDNIEDLLSTCKNKINKFEDQLVTLTECEGYVSTAENLIRSTALDFISEIRNREKFLIEELHTIYGKEAMEFVKRRDEMAGNLDGLKSTCNLTELVLKGKDMELLLLKKQVSEKLTALKELKVEDLPSQTGKQVRFFPGSLEFGYVQDPERPSLSRLRSKRILSSDDYFTTEDLLQDEETQTCKEDLGELSSEEEDEEETEVEEKFSQTILTAENHRIKALDKPQMPMMDKECETDTTGTKEKGVNTRSRGLTTSRRSLENAGDGDVPSPTSGRRRRRRERLEKAKSMDAGGLGLDSLISYSNGEAVVTSSPNSPSVEATESSKAQYMFMPGRRPLLSSNSSFEMNHTSSIDDAFYSPGATPPQPNSPR